VPPPLWDDAPGAGPASNDPPVGPVETGDEAGGALGECCSAHGEPGCVDAMIEACVCGEDPTCCEQAWDADCVDAVAAFGCGDCGDRRVLNVQPRPDAFAIANDREPLLSQLPGHIAIGIEPGAWSIEKAITQDNPF
jgi:hypothetical protein